jgi:hypothetical protein
MSQRCDNLPALKERVWDCWGSTALRETSDSPFAHRSAEAFPEAIEGEEAASTSLHQELKTHIPREVAFVGGYALIDGPGIPFLEKIGYISGKQYLWMERYA